MTDDPTDEALCGGVPFAPTPAEMAAADQSAEVARLREALRKIAAADFNCAPRQYGIAMQEEARAALAAPAAQDDRSAPEDRERWIAEWMRTQREGGG